MGEPAKKINHDIEPDIKPDLGLINGGGNSTPGRASLKALNYQETHPELPSNSSIGDQETHKSNVIKGPWKNNTTNKNVKSKVKFLKRKGPMALILTTILVGGIGITTFFSPGILLVQIKEMMVERFNTQFTSMDVRSTKILKSKMLNGACTVNILCKYSSMTDKQISNFEKAGIKVNIKKKTAFGLNIPDNLEFEGKKILAKDFSNELKNNFRLKSASNIAYNPLFAGFTDRHWGKAKNQLKISEKTKTFAGETTEEKMASMQEDIKQSTSVKKSALIDSKAIDPETGEIYEKTKLDRLNSSISSMNQLVDEASSLGAGETNAATKILNGVDTATNVLKISGAADSGCTIYRTMIAIGYAAKTVRTLQLAYYAMIFLTTADKIKAGEATDQEVAFLGTILTTEIVRGVAKKAATDSFGYKYAAYNDLGKTSNNAMQFMAGGGLSGDMTKLSSYMPSAGKTTCKFLANPLVGLASLIVGVGLLFTPAAPAIAWKDIAQGAIGAIVGAAEFLLPALLKDIIAGNLIDKTTVGENAGDALTSGASGIMGTAARFGGNAPVLPKDAAAYNNLSQQIIAEYDDLDAKTTNNQFDLTNSNTFLGKFAASLVPYTSKIASIPSFLTSIASISAKSFASTFSPLSSAKNVSEDAYTMCTDTEYKELGIASDPYCNVTYAIPTESLEKDPIQVATELLELKINTAASWETANYQKFPQINEEGVFQQSYSKFINNCIERTEPLTISDYSKSADGGNGGSECVFNKKDGGEEVTRSGNSTSKWQAPSLGSVLIHEWHTADPPTCTGTCPGTDHRYYLSNKNLYLYYIDQRVEEDMGGDPISTDNKVTNTVVSENDKKKIQELAQTIIASGRVTDKTTDGQLSQIAAGTRTDVDIRIMRLIADLSTKNIFSISSLKRSGSGDSNHDSGKAVDISGASGVNGATFGYDGYNPIVQVFINEASSLLGDTCEIGVPNNKFVSNTETISKCQVFTDIGTGAHLHFAVEE